MNDDKVSSSQLIANDKSFYFDYQDGKYGWNSSSSRGADTFLPFKSDNDIVVFGIRGGYGGDGTSCIAITNNNILRIQYFAKNVSFNTSDFSGSLTVNNANYQFTITIKKAGTYYILYNYGNSSTTRTFSANGTYTIPARGYHSDFCTFTKIE